MELDDGEYLGRAIYPMEGSNAIHQAEVISWRGKKWLVRDWLDNPAEGWSTPVRAICLDVLRHEDDPKEHPRFVVNDPIPTSVLEGRVPPSKLGAQLVVERPQVKAWLPSVH